MKILFLVTNDWYFWSHRLSLARAIRNAGAEVLVMTRLNEHKAALAAEGFQAIPWVNISSRSVNPYREARALWEVCVAYRRFRPDLTHHIGLKPSLYGGVAAILRGRIPSAHTIAGLGYLFTNPPRRILLLRWLVAFGLWIIQRCGRVRTIFQNPDDRDFFLSASILRATDAALIRGSGVNLKVFSPLPEPTGVPVVTLPARMLWEKGVGEFVAAAELLRRQGINARFALAGRIDRTGAGGVTEEQLQDWARNGSVEWWGHVQDIRSVLSRSNLICLPSYREGLPKVLLEAAACERAVITSDSPGCRESVRDGENGLLVPPKDANALAEAILVLLKNSALRSQMAKRGREIVEHEFSESIVILQTLAVYHELLEGQWPFLNSASSKLRKKVFAEVQQGGS